MKQLHFYIETILLIILTPVTSFAQDYILYNDFISKAKLWESVPCKNDSLKTLAKLSYYDSAFKAVNNIGFLED